MSDNIIIIGILVVILFVAGRSCVKRLKGETSCCGGGPSEKVKRKKLKNVIATKTFIVKVMMCDSCKNRVERCINNIDGAAARVNLGKKEAVISLAREISDEELKAAIEGVGYEIVEIR